MASYIPPIDDEQDPYHKYIYNPLRNLINQAWGLGNKEFLPDELNPALLRAKELENIRYNSTNQNSKLEAILSGLSEGAAQGVGERIIKPLSSPLGIAATVSPLFKPAKLAKPILQAIGGLFATSGISQVPEAMEHAKEKYDTGDYLAAADEATKPVFQIAMGGVGLGAGIKSPRVSLEKIKEAINPNLVVKRGIPKGDLNVNIRGRNPIEEPLNIPKEIQVQLEKNPSFFEKLDTPLEVKASGIKLNEPIPLSTSPVILNRIKELKDQGLNFIEARKIAFEEKGLNVGDPVPELRNVTPVKTGDLPENLSQKGAIGEDYKGFLGKIGTEDLKLRKDLVDDKLFSLQDSKANPNSIEYKLAEFEKSAVEEELGRRSEGARVRLTQQGRDATLPVKVTDRDFIPEGSSTAITQRGGLANIPPLKEDPVPFTPGSRNLSNFERAAYPYIKNLEKANPELGNTAKAYEYNYEMASSKARAAKIDILDRYKLSKQDEQDVISILNGDIIANPSQNSVQAAKELRTILDSFAKHADQYGVLEGYRQNYFPHKIKEGVFTNDMFTPLQSRSGSGIDPALEKARLANNPNWERKLSVLDDYFRHASRRISEAKFFGKNPWKYLEKFEFEKSGKPDTARETAEYISRNFERLTGRERSTQFSRITAKGRYAQALSDLGLSGVSQFGQLAQISSYGGVTRAARGLVSTLANTHSSYRNALRSGVTFSNDAFEVGKSLGSGGKFLWGIGTSDKFLRVVSDTVARKMVKDAVGSKNPIIRSLAKKDLKRLGFTNPSLDPTYVDNVAKIFSDKVNFRVSPLEMPGWTESPYGKIATQYLSFGYQAGRFLKEISGRFVKGDVLPIARFLVAAQVVGEGVNDVKALFKELGKEDQDLKKAVQGTDEKGWIQVLRNKRASNITKRALQNFMSTGGLGILSIGLEKFIDTAESRGKEAGLRVPLGPMGENVVNLGASTAKTGRNLAVNLTGRGLSGVETKKVEAPYRPLVEWGLEQAPVVGFDWKRRVYPPRKRTFSDLDVSLR